MIEKFKNIFSNKRQYDLFNINKYNIDTKKFNHLLHDFEAELEEKICDYVGAKYACIGNSASSLMALALIRVRGVVNKVKFTSSPIYIPSMIPIAVSNVVHNSRIPFCFTDNVDWVGSSYVLYNLATVFNGSEGQRPYKIIDSAQEVRRNQFQEDAENEDLMIFSLYPTKPIGGMDGGIIVSNDKNKIDYFRAATHLGVGSVENESWKRTLNFPGWKMHPNSAQCYVAIKNLEKLDEKNESLDIIRKRYNEAFGIYNKSRHLYRVDVKERKKFRECMESKGIQTGIHYGPAHMYPFYRSYVVDMSHTNEKSKTTVSIPFNEKLKTKDVDFIIKHVEEWL